jgi:nucleotide-binding universal stress UspA family protein
LGADLIVVGAHKGGALRRLLSAEADWGGVAASGTPVLLMPAG